MTAFGGNMNEKFNQLILIVALVILVLILIFACGKDSEGFTIYTVPAGKHYCKPRTVKGGIDRHSLSAQFKVNDTWMMPYQNCRHKVMGISQGRHHENSCTISYHCKDSLQIIGIYGYCDGIRTMFNIDTVGNGTYRVSINHSMGYWIVVFDGKEWKVKAGKKTDWAYVLLPYIGGESTIDHDWICPIKWD